MTETMTAEVRREALAAFVKRTRWYATAFEVATKRFNGIPVLIAEDGTFRHVPAQAWTNTAEGRIYLREGVFAGLPLHQQATYVLNAVATAFRDGAVVDLPAIIRNAEWHARSAAEEPLPPEILHRVGATAAAAFGVLGHEILHGAYSEHTMRAEFQMVLEDLRIESIWMATDPIRA